MKIKTNILLRVYFLFGVISVVGAVVLWKVFYIQQYKDGYWLKVEQQQTMRQFAIEAERGNIYSSDDRLLATSLPYFDIYIDFGADGMTKELFEENIDALSKKMAATFRDKSADTYKRELTHARVKRKRYYPVRKNVTYAMMLEMQTWPLFSAGRFKGGMIAELRQRRNNPYGYLAKRTIGYVRENAPSVGLEASYNDMLGGVSGMEWRQKFAGGWMPVSGALSKQPQNGKDLVSTIRIDLQDATELALLNALKASDAEFGCALVMEVGTGAIRAMANLGRTKSGSYEEINNYAISHRAEPGSTFKLASYLTLLDAGVIGISDTVFINKGRFVFYKRTMRDDHIDEEFLSVKEAFARSSNIAIARLTNRYYRQNKQGFYKKLQEYGLTSKTGIDLIGEVEPVINPPQKWSALSLPWMSTGYEIMLTPLQMLTFYNAVANNGIRMQPYLVERVVENGKVVQTFQPQPAAKAFASKKAVDQAHQLLRQVVEHPNGTAKAARSEYFSLAGKTGTAKILQSGDAAYSSDNQAMFAGFFPAENPRFSCVVLIYQPKGDARTGGSVAAPVFKAIAEKALATDLANAPVANLASGTKALPATRLRGDVAQLKPLLEKYGYSFKVGDDIRYLSIQVENNNVKISPDAVKDKLMPDLKGMAFDDALYLLENAGLKVRYSGMGKVVAQSISPGTPIQKGTSVIIELKTEA